MRCLLDTRTFIWFSENDGKLPRSIAKEIVNVENKCYLSIALNTLLKPELHHRDPFDRLIIAQAISEDLTILTADNHFGLYPVKCLW